MSQERKYRTLGQLTGYIRSLIEQNLGGKRFWLKAEISQVKIHSSGHAYLDLVEQKDGRTISKARANIWRSTLESVRADLGDEFPNVIKQGVEILCLVEVSFSETYGFSISVHEVDLSFNLGEMERIKRETIQRLQKEGRTELNKRFELPTVIQKIAVISSEKSEGYVDLLNQLQNNDFGYQFYVTLFNAPVQGDSAPRIMSDQIRKASEAGFDAIVLVRGGGSKLDLAAFNDYELCAAISDSPLPIITGIGHENDISVADMIANMRLKTPSAVGAYMVERAHKFMIRVETAYSRIHTLFGSIMMSERSSMKSAMDKLQHLSLKATSSRRESIMLKGNKIVRLSKAVLSKRRQVLSTSRDNLMYFPQNTIKSGRNDLSNQVRSLHSVSTTLLKFARKQNELHTEKLKRNVRLSLKYHNELMISREKDLINLHPNRILKRGFSITRKSDKAISHLTKLKEGDLLEIEIYKKKIFVQYLNDEPTWNELKDLVTKTHQKS